MTHKALLSLFGLGVLVLGAIRVDAAVPHNQVFSGPSFTPINTTAGLSIVALTQTFIDTTGPIGRHVVFPKIANMGDKNIVAAPLNGQQESSSVMIINTRWHTRPFFQFIYPFGITYTGGLHLGASTNDHEFIVSPHGDAAPILKVYDVNSSRLVSSCQAYPGSLRTGFKAVGFLDQHGHEHIAVAPDKGGRPQVRLLVDKCAHNIMDGAPYKGGNFTVYNATLRGGVNIAVGHMDGDASVHLVTVPESGSVALVKVYKIYANGGGLILESQFDAFPGEENGATISVADLDHDGTDEIIVVDGAGSSGLVKVFDKTGVAKENYTNYYAFSPLFKGGAQVSFGGYIYNGNGSGGLADQPRAYRLFFAAGPGGSAQIRYIDFPIDK